MTALAVVCLSDNVTLNLRYYAFSHILQDLSPKGRILLFYFKKTKKKGKKNMEHTQIFRRGDIVFVAEKRKSNSLHETNGRYAVVVSDHHKSKQKYVDVAYIGHGNSWYAAAYPVIWHQGAEAIVQCNIIEHIDMRRVLYVDGHCTKKEMARIDATIGGRHNLYAGE